MLQFNHVYFQIAGFVELTQKRHQPFNVGSLIGNDQAIIIWVNCQVSRTWKQWSQNVTESCSRDIFSFENIQSLFASIQCVKILH